MAYGTALAKLGSSNNRVIALDGDTKNSTFAITFKKAHPERYIECYIDEQNLVSVAVGCATRDRNVAFVSTFGAFFSRAFDQIRMGAISQTKVNFCGSHAGISIGMLYLIMRAYSVIMLDVINMMHLGDNVSNEKSYSY